LMLIILIASSFIENIVSITILQNSIKFFWKNLWKLFTIFK
jgi:hypothetical protein